MTKEKNTRPWAPQGVSDYQPFTLEPGLCDQIILQLKHANLDVCDAGALFTDLGHAIAKYHSDNELADTTKPAVVRKNLRIATKRAEELLEQVSALDGVSTMLLRKAMRERAYAAGSTQKVNQDLGKIIASLQAAYGMAQEFQTAGRLPEIRRLLLAQAVARIFRKRLHAEPTTTKSGPYESLLSIVLGAATGREYYFINDLVCSALARE